MLSLTTSKAGEYANAKRTNTMRVACISDVHGNLYALKKALKIIKKLKVDEIIFMGDAVGYIPGIQILRFLKESNINCILGNHEYMLLNGNYTPEKDKIYQHSETLKRSDQQDLEFIRQWPEKLFRENISFFHASPNDHLNEYIYPDTELSRYVNLLDDSRYCVIGHTHRPFIRKRNDKVFVNNGSVGLPRDDGRFGAFSIIDTAQDRAKIIRFDITVEIMRSIKEFGPVHQSIHNLTTRHAKEPIIGERLDD